MESRETNETNELDGEGKAIGRVLGQLLIIVAVVFICGFFINRHNVDDKHAEPVKMIDNGMASDSLIIKE